MASTLTHSPADIMAQLLVDLGHGTEGEDGGTWPIFVNKEPDLPDNCITVRDEQGTSDGRAMATGELFGHDGFRIQLRSASHPVGWTKANTIQNALAESVLQETVTISGSVYSIQCVAKIGDVLVLGTGPGKGKRVYFTINAVLAVRQTT